MDYRFLSFKGIEKMFDDSDMSVGEIIRTITQEKFTGLKISNRSAITDITDREWCSAIEKSLEYHKES